MRQMVTKQCFSQQNLAAAPLPAETQAALTLVSRLLARAERGGHAAACGCRNCRSPRQLHCVSFMLSQHIIKGACRVLTASSTGLQLLNSRATSRAFANPPVSHDHATKATGCEIAGLCQKPCVRHCSLGRRWPICQVSQSWCSIRSDQPRAAGAWRQARGLRRRQQRQLTGPRWRWHQASRSCCSRWHA